MSDIQIVWDLMKKFAEDEARRGQHLKQGEAEAIVVTFMRKAHVNPWPPHEVIEFFARELVGMVDAHAA